MRRARDAGRAGYADHAQDFQFDQGCARDENAQDVAVEVGRSEVQAFVEQIEQVVGDDPLHDILIAKAQAHP